MIFGTYRPKLLTALLASLAIFATTGVSQAATFLFDTDPFEGTTVLATPGRQFVGNELFIPTFYLDEDVIAFDVEAFNIQGRVKFFNGLAADLPSSGNNFIVLQDVDADGDPTNGILNNAGASANLIAARLTEDVAGFFVYFNTPLNLNRLVYSPNLSDPTSDLKIVARFLDQSGQAGIDALPLYRAANFATVAEPAALAFMAVGVAGLGLARRRTGRATA